MSEEIWHLPINLRLEHLEDNGKANLISKKKLKFTAEAIFTGSELIFEITDLQTGKVHTADEFNNIKYIVKSIDTAFKLPKIPKAYKPAVIDLFTVEIDGQYVSGDRRLAKAKLVFNYKRHEFYWNNQDALLTMTFKGDVISKQKVTKSNGKRGIVTIEPLQGDCK